jgi:hypothetical protein
VKDGFNNNKKIGLFHSVKDFSSLLAQMTILSTYIVTLVVAGSNPGAKISRQQELS